MRRTSFYKNQNHTPIGETPSNVSSATVVCYVEDVETTGDPVLSIHLEEDCLLHNEKGVKSRSIKMNLDLNQRRELIRFLTQPLVDAVR